MRSSFVVLLLLVCAAGQDSGTSLLLKANTSRTGSPALERLPRPVSTARRPIQPSPRPAPLPITMQQIVRSSGLIFSGTVISVERKPASARSSVATTETTFRVQQGIRGAHAGEMVQVREWAGLWNSGERYRPGETLVLFLYAPSRLGLTSAIGGKAGRFPVRDGRVIFGPQHAPPLLAHAEDSGMRLKDFVAMVRRAEE